MTRINVCGNCRYWDGEPAMTAEEGLAAGDCHRHAPRPLTYDPRTLMGSADGGKAVAWQESPFNTAAFIWPITYENSWCGEHDKKLIKTEPETDVED